MKKIQITAAAVAAIIGLGGAFAFTTHHKSLPHLIQVRKNASAPLYTYFNSGSLPTGLSCQGISATSACTFSGTATASIYNTNNQSAVPTSNGTTVNYTNTEKAYKTGL